MVAQSSIGGGVCVPWSRFDLPTIWSMLEHEDAGVSTEQAVAWRRTFDLLSAHATNLQTLRDTLAERWPPEHSQASAVFLDYLDGLIGSVPQASSASTTNANALSDLTDILASAKARVRPLYEQWQANVNSGKPDPKVLASLKDQATTIMSQADDAVYQQGERFVVPPEYEAFPDARDPYTPFLPPNVSVSAAGQASSAIPPVHVRIADASTAPLSGAAGNAGAGAPILSGGVVAPPASGGAPPGLPVPQIGSSVGTPVSAGLLPGAVIGLGMSNAARSYGASGDRFTMSGMGGSSGGSRSAAGGFAEGESLGATNGGLVRRGTAAAPGGGEAAGAPGGMGGMLGGAGSDSRRRRLDGGEAYTEWPVASGGPAVLMPPREPDDHDPGPGVIGIDR